MPLFYVACTSLQCGNNRRTVADKRPALLPCEKCGSPTKFFAGTGSTSIMETFDNGLMPKKVERYADVERMIKERSKNKDEPGIV